MSGNIGAYSEAKGYEFIRKNIVKFMLQRDGCSSNKDKIILTEGGSEGVDFALEALISDSKDGIMVPIP